MGFGHRVYKSYDPRAKLIKQVADSVFAETGVDPKLEIALELERIALEDEYFISRRLYPNVDFYSGLIYKAMGYPTDYFTVLFALGRLPGWIAQWEEMLTDPEQKIARPRQIYVGAGRAAVRPDRRAPVRCEEPSQGGSSCAALQRFLLVSWSSWASPPESPPREPADGVGARRRRARTLGVPWTLVVRTVHARPGYRPLLVLLDGSGSFGGTFHGTRIAPGLYRISIVFPHTGSWRYEIADPVQGDWSFVAPHVSG